MAVIQASVSDCSIPRLCRLNYQHFYSSSPPHLSQPLSGSFFFLLLPPISSGCHLQTSHLHLFPTSFTGSERRPHGRIQHPPPPASAARSAPSAACLRLPLCPALITPLLPPSSCTQVPVGPWGFAFRRSLRISVSRLFPCVLIRFPSSYGLWSSECIFVQRRGASALPLPSSHFSRPPYPRYLATPAPSGYPDPPPTV